ncbi:uracil phosphoribosyltransferase-domain-containing protein [Penicillium angulare]|uniref:Uracil phosphoribosyltransferase-domain-containing protein n=1 Tax=Penicillium angulare TaxID=116970 RepID=A0A9W9GF09_9EURO|nr:uracil phosphoribosyltransferase-domain-containing protein [Penicillium angulare]
MPAVIGLLGMKGYEGPTLRNEAKKSYVTMLDGVYPGATDEFLRLEETAQAWYRKRAMERIFDSVEASGKAGIVENHTALYTGEYDDEGNLEITVSQEELRYYTHIICLDRTSKPDVAIYAHQTYPDNLHPRKLVVRKKTFTSNLRDICFEEHTHLATLGTSYLLEAKLSNLLRDLESHNYLQNVQKANEHLERLIAGRTSLTYKVLLFNADTVLTGDHYLSLFWQNVSIDANDTKEYPLLESGLHMDDESYQYFKSRQAMLLCEESFDDAEFKVVCEQTAKKISIRPEFINLLRKVRSTINACCILMTCGPPEFWESILENEGLSGDIDVIGGARLSDGFVVTPHLMSQLAVTLKNKYNMQIWAFGDENDAEMLQHADLVTINVGKAVKPESEAKD